MYIFAPVVVIGGGVAACWGVNESFRGAESATRGRVVPPATNDDATPPPPPPPLVIAALVLTGAVSLRLQHRFVWRHVAEGLERSMGSARDGKATSWREFLANISPSAVAFYANAISTAAVVGVAKANLH